MHPGQSLLHYKLIEKIGQGGMGVVWRAEDTELHRQVALKVLPEAFAADAERLARFEREARLLASLNHPCIAAVYGLHACDTSTGSAVRFLAMELVEGEDLAVRLARGPLPLDDALRITARICEALEAAHDAGVVHRDLKPANVMLATGDKVKVLDFGLAKALVTEPVSGADSSTMMSPTITSAGTRAGMILGTAAYMSPEQSRGKAVDRRVDIWALGCTLYEMLTGRAPFRGETVTDTLAAVVRAEPDWEALPRQTPPAVRRMLRRSLEKDPTRRLRDAGDLRLEIEEADDRTTDDAVTHATGATLRRRELAAWLLAAVAIAAAAWSWFAPSSESSRSSVGPIRFSFDPPGFNYGLAEDLIFDRDSHETVAVSPDGSTIAYSALDDGRDAVLWVRSLTQAQATPLEGTDGAGQLFWSPDGKRIAFRAQKALFAVPASGGHVQQLAPSIPQSANGGSWGSRGTILVGSVRGVWRSNADGGELTLVREETEFGFWPSFLPDGDRFLYLTEIDPTRGQGAKNLGVHVGSLSDRSLRRLIVPVSSRAAYSEGHLLYIREGALTARPFDPDGLAFTGEPVVLADNLDYFESHGGSTFSAGASVLVFAPNKPPNEHRWIDRNGEDRGRLAEPASYARVTSIARDGKQAIGGVQVPRIGTSDLVLFDLERGVSTRVTTETTWESYPVWSPDGRKIAYSADPDGPPDVWVLDLDNGTRQRRFARPGVQHAVGWTPNGEEILFLDHGAGSKLWSMPAGGDGEPAPVVPAFPQTSEVSFSPDGRWLAFSSLESGRFEVYVQPYKRPGSKVRLSPNGGRRPRWRPDGKEIWFQTGRSVIAVPVEPGEGFVSGRPVALFTLAEPFAFQDGTPDGERFLVVLESRRGDFEPLQVMVGWERFVRP